MESEGKMSGRSDDTLAGNRKRMDTFLDRLAQTGNVMLSAKAAGVPRRTVYRWRDKWSTFAGEWDDALDEAVDMLEGMAWKRAAKTSDRLLMFLLKAHRRGFYGDKQEVELSGKDGGAIQLVAVGGLDPEEDI